ncbi:MAG: aspartate 1-decarboxylase [Fimbriimonadales bacterium]|nr:aspartate 1-decarboxylase [Fimbriimonadales bacterium]MDW8051653.1 aspartate 1-decarboxylase [Armatimonadota bacterium]
MRLVERLKGKIHMARVTESRIDYIGSIAIDEQLMEAIGLEPGEMVHVWVIDNGERFQTYVVPAPAGSGEVAVYGAAAHKAQKGHRLIIASTVFTDEWVEPKMVLVNEKNQIVQHLPFKAQALPAELS